MCELSFMNQGRASARPSALATVARSAGSALPLSFPRCDVALTRKPVDVTSGSIPVRIACPTRLHLWPPAHQDNACPAQVLEKLFRAQWTNFDGLGALIISPTRELALQIFEELRKVGQYHDISAGLLIGGKDVKEEKSRINSALPSHLPPMQQRLMGRTSTDTGHHCAFLKCSAARLMVAGDTTRQARLLLNATAVGSNIGPH